MLTEFGKLLRKIRIDRSEILKNMADALGISSAYLSAIEVGKRAIPFDFVRQIQKVYSLGAKTIEELQEAADRTTQSIKLNLVSVPPNKRNAALVFARNFESMDNATAQNILKLFDKEESI